MKSLLDYFQSRHGEILESIRNLVEIESPSFDVEGSRAAVDFLVGEAEKISLNLKIERVFRENYGEHLVIRAFENVGGEKPVLLLGHTDTVHPRGSLCQNPTRIEGDKFYGCGIFDMKANCVLILEILRAFSELNLTPKHPVTILLSCDEEVGSETGRALVEAEAAAAAFCLVCEPSAGGRAKTGRKGTAWLAVKARGIPAHAGLEPEKGASAILELSKQIQTLHALNAPERGTTVNVCTIKGGTTSNVIPEFAELEVDVRFTAMSEAERILSEIQSLESFDNRVSLEIEGGLNRPPLERSARIIELYEKARKIAVQMNYEFGETQVGGASDGNFVAALGVPVLDGLGVTGDGAHTLREHILISDVPKRAALVAALML
ncbi:MAG TPA: M20 family metallopeptidase [Pyrinomonadaceae bacterium]|nr:M20 family metallopeptidase [Pyrinomonadaceae bacterium]